MNRMFKPQPPTESIGPIYCPMCTHTVEATIVTNVRKQAWSKPRQKCPRCQSSLDAGYIMRVRTAA